MSTLDKISRDTLISRSLHAWKEYLSPDCQVYRVNGAGYLAKQFDEIQYRFTDKETAKDILSENIRTILYEQYFKQPSDEEIRRIEEIIKYAMNSIRQFIPSVTLNPKTAKAIPNIKLVRYLPDGCIAFRNGVFDFRNNNWLFKYTEIDMGQGLSYISYNSDYIIQFFFNFNFEPLPIDIRTTDLSEFVNMLKEIDKTSPNLCYELCYNMSFNSEYKFSQERLEHLCEIFGYTCLNSFSQYFIMLIGNGQNGKNSLFDGCFTPNIVPKPTSNSLVELETDNFITGVLEGSSHNIFLETSSKTYKDSTMLKALTGSEDQTIEHKSVNKYQGIINCKYIFSANDKEEVKFDDTTNGFIRRINMYEIFYTWDSHKNFLKLGNFYDCTFSPDLRELKDDDLAVITYLYFAAYGMKAATNNFTKPFAFTHNEWKLDYSTANIELKDSIDSFKLSSLVYDLRTQKKKVDYQNVLYSKYRKALYREKVNTSSLPLFEQTEDWRAYTNQEDYTVSFSSFNSFSKAVLSHIVPIEKDDEGNIITEDVGYDLTEEFIKTFDIMYISVQYLYTALGFVGSSSGFSRTIQKIYGNNSVERMGQNRLYLRCTFKNGKLEVIK